MGGNALASGSIRLAAQRYHVVEQDLLTRLRTAFPTMRTEAVLAYTEKPDFGDLDILVEDGDGFDPQRIAQALQASEIVRNGDVTSIGVLLEEGVFQVDLLKTPPASFDFAARYFGFNDLGNLLGRIAHKFGAKFGHLGLLYPLRDPENSDHLIAEVLITNDFAQALTLLGYDAQHYELLRANGGFRNLLDIFQFVVSSPYANLDIYLLENRNHKSRIRDSKRPTYNAFLDWLEQQTDATIPAFPWAEPGSAERELQRQEFLVRAWTLVPEFRLTCDQAQQAFARQKRLKSRFNGELVSAVTGLSGKALGELMAQVRKGFASQTEFESFFLEEGEDAIRQRLLAEAETLR